MNMGKDRKSGREFLCGRQQAASPPPVRHRTAVWQPAPAPAAAASVSRPAAFTFTQGQTAAGGQLLVRRSCFTPLSAAD